MDGQKICAPHARFFLVEPGIAANKILQPLISAQISDHQLGLSDITGEYDFYEEENAGEQSSFILAGYHRQYNTVKVAVQTLDDFCQENHIQTFSLLKIDCEGYDFKVLLGAKKLLTTKSVQYIQFEYGTGWKMAGSTLKAAVHYLNKFGYIVWSISPKGLVDFDVDFYGDYFEYSNFFAARALPAGLKN